MARQAIIRKKILEQHNKGSRLRDFILGWQDGLVNVLGVILGVVAAAQTVNVVLIAAVAAAMAESISMAAVAYTSFKAEYDFYKSEENREKREIKEVPQTERSEIRQIYRKFGFKGALLEKIVKHITSDKKRWLEVMMSQELKLAQPHTTPISIAAVVGFSALIGSFIPVIPFLIFPMGTATWVALILSTCVLFGIGIYKAKTTVGNPIKSGIEMMIIGMAAAIAGYLVGTLLGSVI